MYVCGYYGCGCGLNSSTAAQKYIHNMRILGPCFWILQFHPRFRRGAHSGRGRSARNFLHSCPTFPDHPPPSGQGGWGNHPKQQRGQNDKMGDFRPGAKRRAGIFTQNRLKIPLWLLLLGKKVVGVARKWCKVPEENF